MEEAKIEAKLIRVGDNEVKLDARVEGQGKDLLAIFQEIVPKQLRQKLVEAWAVEALEEVFDVDKKDVKKVDLSKIKEILNGRRSKK